MTVRGEIAQPRRETGARSPEDPEDLFDPLPLLLTDGVAGVSRRPTFNGTGPSRFVLGHMRRHREPR